MNFSIVQFTRLEYTSYRKYKYKLQTIPGATLRVHHLFTVYGKGEEKIVRKVESWKYVTYNITEHVCCAIFDVYGNCVFKFTPPYIPCSIFCIFVSRLCWVNIKSTQIHTIPVERGQIWTHWYIFFCRYCIYVVNCSPILIVYITKYV